MKKLLTATLLTGAIVLSAIAQQPPPPPPGAPATNQPSVAPPAGGPAGTNPAATNPTGATNPAAGAPATTTQPGAPGAAGAPGTTAMSPGAAGTNATTATTSTTTAASPSPSPSAAPKGPQGLQNEIIDKFNKGGWIMWPILVVSIIGLAVVLERAFWWLGRWMRRDPKRIEKVFTAIENGDIAEASRLSRGTRDPVLRMMFNGLNHQHASLQGALQVAAGIEIKRAGRFLVVMDTLVTLAPLLGLLGTITGLMRSFASLGNEELAVNAVTGGIAEALIATACGLFIAIFELIPFNFFTSRVANLEFELQTAATNLEVMLEAHNVGGRADVDIHPPMPTTGGKGSSI